MDVQSIRVGLKVRVSKLGTTQGWAIAERFLQHRQLHTEGVVIGFAAGHGGDVWGVCDRHGVVSAYRVDELEPLAGT